MFRKNDSITDDYTSTMKNNEPIFVTKPLLQLLEKFQDFFEQYQRI
jgi:hypothetical protein